MTSETPSPILPVLPFPNLPPLPPQLTPKSRRGRAHARAPPHDLPARYLSAERSTRGTPSSRAVCHFGREDARRASTHSISLGQPTYTTRRTSPRSCACVPQTSWRSSGFTTSCAGSSASASPNRPYRRAARRRGSRPNIVTTTPVDRKK
jgi:hypothetical protein